MECRRVLVLAVLSATLCACSRMPTPSVPEAKLTADDLEVFAAVVNDTIRKPREADRERLKPARRRVNESDPILVGDETLQTCESYDFSPWKCIEPPVACLGTYPLALQERGRKSYRISDAFAPDVLIVDSDFYRGLLRQPGWVGTLKDRLRARYPQVQTDVAAVFLTAPLYPNPREAIVLMRHYFNGASCLLLRLKAVGWSVERALGGWIE